MPAFYIWVQRAIYAKPMGWERWRATTKRGASDARRSRMRRRVAVVALRSPDVARASDELSNLGDLRPPSPRRLDLRSASEARDTNAALAVHECAPSGLHEYCATIYFNCRHMSNGFCDSIREISWSRAARVREADALAGVRHRGFQAACGSSQGTDSCVLGTRSARLGRFPMGRAHPQGAVTTPDP